MNNSIILLSNQTIISQRYSHVFHQNNYYFHRIFIEYYIYRLELFVDNFDLKLLFYEINMNYIHNKYLFNKYVSNNKIKKKK